ncbi:hypothetical protein LGW14_07955 [Streptococcus mutans]|nr:hypothetical protein [Streptococcus mutans]
MTLEAGDICAFIGSNGAGKSTYGRSSPCPCPI